MLTKKNNKREHNAAEWFDPSLLIISQPLPNIRASQGSYRWRRFAYRVLYLSSIITVSSIMAPRHGRLGSAAAGRPSQRSPLPRTPISSLLPRPVPLLRAGPAPRQSLAPQSETVRDIRVRPATDGCPVTDPATGHQVPSGGGGPGRLEPADERLPSGEARGGVGVGVGGSLTKRMSRSFTVRWRSLPPPLALL